MRGCSAFAGFVMVGLAVTGADAAVMISDAQTQNMTCSGRVCAPTAANAVLNVTDLEALEAGPATVTTTGSGVQAGSIVIQNALTWTTPNTLTFDANQSIEIGSTVSIGGTGGLSIVTNDGGTGGSLTFGPKGHVTFASLGSALTIDGANYTLVRDIQTLADDTYNNPGGNFALAADYDASGDGTYQNSPVAALYGNFEGLGNTIRNFKLYDSEDTYIGLFGELNGRISDIGLVNADVEAGAGDGEGRDVGALVGFNVGTVTESYSTGTVAGEAGWVGGLIGMVGEDGYGTVEHSHSSATVTLSSETTVDAAGLAGANQGMITNSYATGAVTGTSVGEIKLGGLVGDNQGNFGGNIESSFASGAISGGSLCGGLAGETESGQIGNSYAMGSVTCDGQSRAAGGFTTENSGSIILHSYSTGKAEADDGNNAGFLVWESKQSPLRKDYWDTTTSGMKIGVHQGSSKGLTGLTTKRFQSRPPPGFSREIWAEDPKINNGFPYLIANPPPK